MKTNLKFLILLFAVAVVLCSCSKDNGNLSASNVEKKLLSYAWESDMNYDINIYGDPSDPDVHFDREKSTYLFLNDETGIIVTKRYAVDTYFGSSYKTLTTGFDWYLGEDGTLSISSGPSQWLLQGDDLIQQNISSRNALHKTSITSEYRAILELAPWLILEGFDRADFPVDVSISTYERGYVKSGNTYYYPIDAHVKLYAKDHIRTRHISEVEITFSIKSGGSIYGGKSKVVKTISVQEDKDINETFSMLMHISGNNPIIKVSCRAWDYETGKYYTMYDFGTDEISVSKPEYLKDVEKDVEGKSYEYVDLGLSVKWATCNVGASSPDGYGDFYAWGETSTKSDYSWSTYKWCKGTSTTMTKYCTNQAYGTVDNKTTLDLEDDIAHVKWGGNWRIPTYAELKELADNCTWSQYTYNGVKGLKGVSKKNGNSIFLPYAGREMSSSTIERGTNAYYWSCSVYYGTCYQTRCYSFGTQPVSSPSYRLFGLSVRPVIP